MIIVTERSLDELRGSGVNCSYTPSPKGRDFYVYSSGKSHGEAFNNFVGLLVEEGYSEGYGICEVRESDEHKDKGLVCLLGRIITIESPQRMAN